MHTLTMTQANSAGMYVCSICVHLCIVHMQRVYACTYVHHHQGFSRIHFQAFTSLQAASYEM
jgi:hypothetical protein